MLSGRQILIALAIKYQGDWNSIYSAISSKEICELNTYLEEFNKSTCKATTILDADYPQILKQIYMPPFVLFYYGDITLTHNPSKCLSIIGSRNPSSYGVKMATSLSEDLSNEYHVVSGMAKGIDGIAHRSAIKMGNKTIAIIGSGIDNVYPQENKDLYQILKKEHLVMSEYFGQVSPDSAHFPLRNRIIAGLSKATLIVEAQKQSGTSITATYALSFSRTVLAVPNTADSNSACNRLIKEGAVLVENAKDVIEELNQTAFVGSEIQQNS
ncbi:MAG: DNA-processing protein DprA [Bacilli bacterium]|nr:DNA-processing protein DprA [Bacilli bacterium]